MRLFSKHLLHYFPPKETTYLLFKLLNYVTLLLLADEQSFCVHDPRAASQSQFIALVDTMKEESAEYEDDVLHIELVLADLLSLSLHTYEFHEDVLLDFVHGTP